MITGSWTDDIDTSVNASPDNLAQIWAAILNATFLGSWVVKRDIERSLDALKVTMTKLAEGDLLVSVPGTKGETKSAGMAEAVVVFKHTRQQNEQLSAERAREPEHAALAKLAALDETGGVGSAHRCLHHQCTKAVQQALANIRIVGSTATAARPMGPAPRPRPDLHGRFTTGRYPRNIVSRSLCRAGAIAAFSWQARRNRCYDFFTCERIASQLLVGAIRDDPGCQPFFS